MSDAKTKRLNESQNPVINGGLADEFHKIILPQNTTANLSQIVPNQPGSIAYDTTLNQMVVNTGSGFVPLEIGSGAVIGSTSVKGASLANGGLINVPLTGSVPLTIDSVTYTTGDQILLLTQTSTPQNGVYTYSDNGVTYTLTRSVSWTTAADFALGRMVTVRSGTQGTGLTFAQDATITTLGVDTPVFRVHGFRTTNVPFSLTPAITNIETLGSSTLYWASGNIKQLNDTSAIKAIDIHSRALSKPSSGTPALNWSGSSVNLFENLTFDHSLSGSATVKSADGNSSSDNGQDLTITAGNGGATAAVGGLLKLSGGLIPNLGAGVKADVIVDGSALDIYSNSGNYTVPVNFFDLTNTNYISLQAPDTVTAPVTFKLPNADGTPGQFLQTDGSGVMSWQTAGSGANQALSNLSATSINQSLVPATNSEGLGISSRAWNAAYIVDHEIFRDASTKVGDLFGHSSGAVYLGGLGSNQLVLQPNGGTVSLSNQQIVSLADPTLAQDAATKNYTDTHLDGIVISGTAPTNGQVLSYNSGTTQWEPVTPSGGGGLTLPINNNSYVTWRNAANTADINVLELDSSNIIRMGDPATIPAIHIGGNSAYASIGNSTITLNAGASGSPSSDVEIDANTIDLFAGDGTSQLVMNFWDGVQTNALGLMPPATLTGTTTWTLPDGNGSAGQVLTTDGATPNASLSWSTPSIGVQPNNTYIKWRNAANTADMTVVGVAADDSVSFGDPSGSSLLLFPSSGYALLAAGNTSLKEIDLQADLIEIYGYSSTVSPSVQWFTSQGKSLTLKIPSPDVTANYEMTLPGDCGAAAGLPLVTDGANPATLSWGSLFVTMPSGSSDPSGAPAGAVYFNTGSNKLKMFNGTSWETITSA